MTDSRLIDWAIKEVEEKYSDQVSLLLEHNFYSLKEDKHVRYVNTIISDSKEYIGLARTFIINGIGYDFNQVSWKSFERDAEGKGYYPTVLADADILYSKNDEDLQHFLYLRAKFKSNLSNSRYMYLRGLEWLNHAMEIYKTMLFESDFGIIRKAAGFVADYLAMAVACLNQTYFKSFTRLEELREMKYLPEQFIEQYKHLISLQSPQELTVISHSMIQSIRNLFQTQDPREVKNAAPDYQYLADWYQECCYYFRRIRHFCSQGDAFLAFRETCAIQADLDDLSRDFNLDGLSLLSRFDEKNLIKFSDEVHTVENIILDAITTHQIKIDSYASVDEFLSQNS